MMAPFMKQMADSTDSFKAEEANGFDVITFNSMMHRSPDQITLRFRQAEIELISSESFWLECEHAVKKSCIYLQSEINLTVTDYLFTIQLGNPESRALVINEGYSGFGGIPGLSGVHSCQMSTRFLE